MQSQIRLLKHTASSVSFEKSFRLEQAEFEIVVWGTNLGKWRTELRSDVSNLTITAEDSQIPTCRESEEEGKEEKEAGIIWPQPHCLNAF